MKVSVEATNRSEAEAIRRAMKHAPTKALVLVIGHLLKLPSDRARRRVLACVADKLQEEQGR